ncbi:unnamed protein product [Amoebophrya sp. A120]|nr:unnamed protein product [Amoebophrya sp. A120]|eukprot:GSA120T00002929001.1
MSLPRLPDSVTEVVDLLGLDASFTQDALAPGVASQLFQVCNRHFASIVEEAIIHPDEAGTRHAKSPFVLLARLLRKRRSGAAAPREDQKSAKNTSVDRILRQLLLWNSYDRRAEIVLLPLLVRELRLARTAFAFSDSTLAARKRQSLNDPKDRCQAVLVPQLQRLFGREGVAPAGERSGRDESRFQAFDALFSDDVLDDGASGRRTAPAALGTLLLDSVPLLRCTQSASLVPRPRLSLFDRARTWKSQRVEANCASSSSRIQTAVDRCLLSIRKWRIHAHYVHEAQRARVHWLHVLREELETHTILPHSRKTAPPSQLELHILESPVLKRRLERLLTLHTTASQVEADALHWSCKAAKVVHRREEQKREELREKPPRTAGSENQHSFSADQKDLSSSTWSSKTTARLCSALQKAERRLLCGADLVHDDLDFVTASTTTSKRTSTNPSKQTRNESCSGSEVEDTTNSAQSVQSRNRLFDHVAQLRGDQTDRGNKSKSTSPDFPSWLRAEWLRVKGLQREKPTELLRLAQRLDEIFPRDVEPPPAFFLPGLCKHTTGGEQLPTGTTGTARAPPVSTPSSSSATTAQEDLVAFIARYKARLQNVEAQRKVSVVGREQALEAFEQWQNSLGKDGYHVLKQFQGAADLRAEAGLTQDRI